MHTQALSELLFFGTVPGMNKDIRYYLQLWRKRFSQPRAVRWHDGWLENDYCPDCRYCCGPQDSPEPYPMALLPEQLRPQNCEDFYMADSHTAYLDQRGCKACGSSGCRLERRWRPLACGLFPIVPASNGLYLYKTCPAVLLLPLALWLDLGLAVARHLQTLSPKSRQHISLCLTPEKLADSFISLHTAL